MPPRLLDPRVLAALGLVALDQGCEKGGFCLSQAPDTGEVDTRPCLDVAACLDTEVPDTYLGPCLSTGLGPWDSGDTDAVDSDTDDTDAVDTDTDAVDAGTGDSDAVDSDTDVADTTAAATPRGALLDRLAADGVLPADVVARLRGRAG